MISVTDREVASKPLLPRVVFVNVMLAVLVPALRASAGPAANPTLMLVLAPPISVPLLAEKLTQLADALAAQVTVSVPGLATLYVFVDANEPPVKPLEVKP